MLISVSTEDIDILAIGIENNCLMWRKIISVFADGFPSIVITALCCLYSIWITAFALILLILGLQFLLINPYNIKIHPTDLVAPILKPVNLLEAVNVETVLLRIAFE